MRVSRSTKNAAASVDEVSEEVGELRGSLEGARVDREEIGATTGWRTRFSIGSPVIFAADQRTAADLLAGAQRGR